MSTLYLYDQNGRFSGTVESVAGAPLPKRFTRVAPSPSLEFPVWAGGEWVEAGSPPPVAVPPSNPSLSVILKKRSWYWLLEKYNFYSLMLGTIATTENTDDKADLRACVFGSDLYFYDEVVQKIDEYSAILPDVIKDLTANQMQDMWIAAVAYQDANNE